MGSQKQRRLQTLHVFLGLFCIAFAIGSPRGAYARGLRHALWTATPAPQAQVIPLSSIPAARAAAILSNLFKRAQISIDANSNSVVVLASPEDVQQIRAVAQGIDVRNPRLPVTEAVPLRWAKAAALLHRLKAIYRGAYFEIAPPNTILVRTSPQELAEIKTLISVLDTTLPTPAPTVSTQDSFRVTFNSPRTLARAVQRQVSRLRVSVSGSSIVFSGDADDVSHAKILATSLDVPNVDARYTQIYHLHAVDATSIGDFISKSFPTLRVTVDHDLNSISVTGTSGDQARIAASLLLMDPPQGAAQPGSIVAGPALGDGNVLVVNLRSAIPGSQGAPSTTATEIAQAVQQTLSSMAPELHLTPLPTTSQIILAGNPQSIHLAQTLIARLDVPQPLVVLDTEVLEVDESVSRHMGLQVPGGFVSATYTEVLPTPDPYAGQPRIGRFQALTRTPISFGALVNFLVQNGAGRVLADPRVTTVSGRDATITAGDTINVLTQTGGGITPITQQLQSFQTGVSLDITPIVNDDGTVTVSVHPRVSSVAPTSAGTVPNIQQREATTIVELRDNQTLVIGGLIQDSSTRTITKIPFLGDLPLVGKIFQDNNVNHARNELIISVTPHVVRPGQAMPAPERAAPLPTPDAIATTLPIPKVEPTHETRREPVPIIAPTPAPVARLPEDQRSGIFTYGSPPPPGLESNDSAPRIYFAQLAPTTLRDGDLVRVTASTSKTVNRVTIGTPGHEVALRQLGTTTWEVTYSMNSFGMSGRGTVNLSLTAYSPTGTASVQIPVNLPPT